jgi:hypothetical protein
MTISHDRITLTTPDQPVVFASPLGFSCSVCAPDAMTEAEVAAFPNREGPKPSVGESIAVEKAGSGSASQRPILATRSPAAGIGSF